MSDDTMAGVAFSVAFVVVIMTIVVGSKFLGDAHHERDDAREAYCELVGDDYAAMEKDVALNWADWCQNE